MSVPSSAPPAPTRSGLAFPGRLVVVLVFMVQFITLLLGLGGFLPYLHQHGVGTILLVLGAFTAFALQQAALTLVLRFTPVRCINCQGRSRFAGFGWWPFIYRFTCGVCGLQRRIEIGG